MRYAFASAVFELWDVEPGWFEVLQRMRCTAGRYEPILEYQDYRPGWIPIRLFGLSEEFYDWRSEMEASSWNLREFPSGHHRQGLERRAESSDERDKLAVELRRDGKDERDLDANGEQRRVLRAVHPVWGRPDDRYAERHPLRRSRQ